ncbi:MAG: FadR family transcriptional regulator, partial [Victivallaceae bacterium]|nr:FadR family transcriptional regulator [Victivallaceae bacterium]
GNALELFKVRKMLEIEAVALAVEQITNAQRNELKFIMERLAKADTEEKKVKLDAEFHFKIIEASNNYLLKCFYNAVSSIMKSFISDARKIFLKAEKMNKLSELHKDIYEAIISGDPDKAKESIQKHFDFVIENFEK